MGLSYGSAEFPNCRGLAVNEVQRIDFERLDFSNFYQDLEGQMQVPGQGDLAQQAQARIEEFYRQRQ